jgi:OmcA/MtrC family decaheme c-type cytochrome
VSATELNITVDSVSIASPPVVEFTVTDQDGDGFPGLTGSDLRFNIAKLIPVANGNPSQWQDYILRERDGAVQGTQERDRTGSAFGEFVDNGDGTYTYTFETDITNVSCPAPCTDADGNALDVSYQPGLTHRLGIQQGNRDLPTVNAEFDFVPDGSAVTNMREIVKTANCNECHDKLTAHGSRFDTRLCVTCHNPGSWLVDDDGDKTVDFKVMIHKIHRGENLPSVEAGGSYHIGSHDFSDVVFPQDIRNCTKCHDGDDPDTPQGNNWQLPNMAACGSCHDDISFDIDGSGCFPDPEVATCTPEAQQGHRGGIVTDNSMCSTCHAEGRIAGSVDESHTIPGKAERDLFQFNILEICGNPPGPDAVCPPSAPGVPSPVTVKFSVTDPSGATTHGYDNAYDINSTTGDPEFTAGSNSSLSVLVAWSTTDYTNEGGNGTRPARAESVSVGSSDAVTDNGDGTFTLDGAAVDPPLLVPENATGSGAIGMEGHPAADDGTGEFSVRVPADSEVAYFAITDSEPKPRRTVVDVQAKCDNCHDVLSLHGGNRNNNAQECVLCHNPSNTDVAQRPKDAAGLPDTAVTEDGKKEESIDFKRLIHAIHAADFRTGGLVIYGFGGRANDFGDVRFPGVLSKCETCHSTDPDTYTLEDRSSTGGGNWALPAMNGIKGSTVDSAPNAANAAEFDAKLIDQTDDWKYSPIASVCSACHDGTPELAHMADNGALLGGSGSEQAAQEGNVEICPVCHGPGRLADVEVVHND